MLMSPCFAPEHSRPGLILYALFRILYTLITSLMPLRYCTSLILCLILLYYRAGTKKRSYLLQEVGVKHK